MLPQVCICLAGWTERRQQGTPNAVLQMGMSSSLKGCRTLFSEYLALRSERFRGGLSAAQDAGALRWGAPSPPSPLRGRERIRRKRRRRPRGERKQSHARRSLPHGGRRSWRTRETRRPRDNSHMTSAILGFNDPLAPCHCHTLYILLQNVRVHRVPPNTEIM